MYNIHCVWFVDVMWCTMMQWIYKYWMQWSVNLSSDSDDNAKVNNKKRDVHIIAIPLFCTHTLMSIFTFISNTKDFAIRMVVICKWCIAFSYVLYSLESIWQKIKNHHYFHGSNGKLLRKWKEFKKRNYSFDGCQFDYININVAIVSVVNIFISFCEWNECSIVIWWIDEDIWSWNRPHTNKI